MARVTPFTSASCRSSIVQRSQRSVRLQHHDTIEAGYLFTLNRNPRTAVPSPPYFFTYFCTVFVSFIPT